MHRKLIMFHLQVLQEHQKQEATRVKPESHDESQTHESDAEQGVGVQELSTATTLQMTNAQEKASDIQIDYRLENVIPDRETENIDTNITTTDTKVKLNNNLFQRFIREELASTPCHKKYKKWITLFS